MHSEPAIPDLPAEDNLPPALLEALRTLPSEQSGPSRETDAAIMATLADQPLPRSSQAVVVEVCGEDKCTTIITYVGQTVKINQHRVTIRTDERGAIVVDSPASDLHIKTRRI